MSNSIILKIYPTHREAQDCHKSDSKYLEDREGFVSRKQHLQITFDGYDMYYVGGVNDFPHKIQGFRADVIEIYDNCLDEDVLNEVIAPMEINAKVLFIDRVEGIIRETR